MINNGNDNYACTFTIMADNNIVASIMKVADIFISLNY